MTPIINRHIFAIAQHRRNLVGSPVNRAVEPTRMGPVLPEGSNFNHGIPIVSLGGRGVGASLALHYNGRVWARDDKDRKSVV